MANELRVYQDFLGGRLDADAASGAVSLSSPGFAALPVIDTTNHMLISIDPDGLTGEPFVLRITAHTAANTAVTVDATPVVGSPRAVKAGCDWVHSVVASDIGRTLGYAQVTANQTGITTEADLTGLTATVTVAAGRRIRISGQGLFQSTVDNDYGYLRIKESTTVLSIAPVRLYTVDALTLYASVILTPSAGSHTYKLSFARNSGTGSLSLVAGATFPAFILVEDIGT